MKLFLILLLPLFAALLVSGQPVSKGQYLVLLKDKGNTKALLNQPEKYLSQKSLERRIRQNIQIDESDLPLNESYLSEIIANNSKILTRSRWFNYVVIESSGENAQRIGKLPFVGQVKALRPDSYSGSMPSSKEFFNYESYAPHPSMKQAASPSGTYDYGAAANQINMLRGEILHDMGYSGQGMTIAVLDAGFANVNTMPAFDSLRANNQIIGVHNFVDPAGSVYDPFISQHGTMVLSTMGANLSGEMVGTAPKADYWLLRSEDAGAEYILEEYYWVEAAEFADSVGADIINSSLGYTTFDDPASNHTYADMDGNTTYITIGADKAAEKGILVVNSAGNSGGSSWNYIGAPADGDSVFSIGAVDAFGNYAYFSSQGPTSDGRIKPVVVSQGQNAAVYGPWGLAYGSGTSFSSPIIAGMSACLWQAQPSLINMQIIETLKVNASKADDPDNYIGWGIPDYLASYLDPGATRIDETPDLPDLKVSPNPFRDDIVLLLNPATFIEEFTIEVLDTRGRELLHRKFSNYTSTVRFSDLGYLPSGVYILRVFSKNMSASRKLVKW